MKKVTITLILLCVAAFAQEKGTFTDSRDGKTYNTVKMGEQTWMAQNLNYKLEKGGSWCYNDNEARCDKYGRLYDWNGATKACPSGWHLPSNEDWNKLSTYVDGNNMTYILMNKKFPNFSILLGGGGSDNSSYDSNASATFGGMGGSGGWWTATEGYDKKKAKYRSDNIGSSTDFDKFYLSGVRCVQD